MLSVQPELVQHRAVPRSDEFLPHVRCVRKCQSRPTIHLFDPDGDVGRQRMVDGVLTVVVSTETVSDVCWETGVVVAVRISRVCDELCFSTDGWANAVRSMTDCVEDAKRPRAGTYCCTPANFASRCGLGLVEGPKLVRSDRTVTVHHDVHIPLEKNVLESFLTLLAPESANGDIVGSVGKCQHPRCLTPVDRREIRLEPVDLLIGRSSRR